MCIRMQSRQASSGHRQFSRTNKQSVGARTTICGLLLYNSSLPTAIAVFPLEYSLANKALSVFEEWYTTIVSFWFGKSPPIKKDFHHQ